MIPQERVRTVVQQSGLLPDAHYETADVKRIARKIEEDEDGRHQKQRSSDVKLGMMAPGFKAQVLRRAADYRDAVVIVADLILNTSALEVNLVERRTKASDGIHQTGRQGHLVSSSV